MGTHKSGYVQQSVKIRSRLENNTDIAEMIYELSLWQMFSLFLLFLFIFFVFCIEIYISKQSRP